MNTQPPSLTAEEINKMVSEHRVATPERWLAVDCYLDQLFNRDPMLRPSAKERKATYTGNDIPLITGRAEWIALPRTEGQLAKGDGLVTFLAQYQAWIDAHMSLREQTEMLGNIAADELQKRVPEEWPHLPLADIYVWLELAAMRYLSSSVTSFILNQLQPVAAAERDKYVKKMMGERC